MNEAVRAYIDAIDPAHRPLFDRLRNLILEAHPEAEETISYEMPTYKVAKRRLYLGAWKHGVSLYGWQEGRDGGFTTRHPELRTGKGTLQLRPEDAATIPDEEFHALAQAALNP
ncbi:iron chaperone [Nonomuraea sp. NPDC050556]|uniref:iron chaperone n=1 Tax=Nonomuraea sp. NPDC050556 TaxID=3364369 RepID=UPI0037BDB239